MPPAVLMTFARYLEHAGMQSRGSKGGGEVCGGRASGSAVSPMRSTIGGLHAEFSLWTTASKRTELHGEWNARPTWIKPTEVSRTRTTLDGYQRVSTGVARPIQTCFLGGLFPREDQRSTRTDVTKLTRNGVKLLANPPAQVSILSTCRMTDRHSAIGRLLRRTFPPTGILLGGGERSSPGQRASD